MRVRFSWTHTRLRARQGRRGKKWSEREGERARKIGKRKLRLCCWSWGLRNGNGNGAKSFAASHNSSRVRVRVVASGKLCLPCGKLPVATCCCYSRWFRITYARPKMAIQLAIAVANHRPSKNLMRILQITGAYFPHKYRSFIWFSLISGLIQRGVTSCRKHRQVKIVRYFRQTMRISTYFAALSVRTRITLRLVELKSANFVIILLTTGVL